MALTKAEAEKLDEVYKATIEVKTVLLGVDGNPGMLKKFEALSKSYYGFRRTTASIFIGLVLSGLVTGGILLLT